MIDINPNNNFKKYFTQKNCGICLAKVAKGFILVITYAVIIYLWIKVSLAIYIVGGILFNP